MQVKALFEKPIDRPINGVVSDQFGRINHLGKNSTSSSSRESLTSTCGSSSPTYAEAIDNPEYLIPGDLRSTSGFFGLGLHFIKIRCTGFRMMSTVTKVMRRRPSISFRIEIQDARLFADVKRAVASNTDVILFDIDSKADTKGRRRCDSSASSKS